MKTFIFLVLVLMCVGIGYYFFTNSRHSAIYWGVAFEGLVTREQLLEETSRVALKPQFVVFYLQWLKDFPLDNLNQIWQYGAVPCLTWEPFFIDKGIKKNILAEEVLSGKYDVFLRSFAESAKNWKHPLIIRFAHEMNLNTYHWGTSAEDFGTDSSYIYINLYRYVVNFFKKNDVHNVLWVFCPNSESVPEKDWNNALIYYPGNDYVDLLGLDGYNWGMDSESYRSFEQIFRPLYEKMRLFSPDKPLIIFETASVQDKTQWLKEAVETCKKWKITSLIWFDVNKEKDWRLGNEKELQPLFTTNPTAQEWVNGVAGLP